MATLTAQIEQMRIIAVSSKLVHHSKTIQVINHLLLNVLLYS